MRPNRTDIAIRARTLVDRNRRGRPPIARHRTTDPTVERILRELRASAVSRGDTDRN